MRSIWTWDVVGTTPGIGTQKGKSKKSFLRANLPQVTSSVPTGLRSTSDKKAEKAITTRIIGIKSLILQNEIWKKMQLYYTDLQLK